MHKLSLLCEEYNTKISTNKLKVTVFKEAEHVQSKVVTSNKPVVQVNSFNCLRDRINYQNDRDMDNKVNKFQCICGTTNRKLRNKVRKETKLKFYKTVAMPTLLYGCETWVLIKKS